MESTTDTPLERACKAAGNQTKLARALGREKAAVSAWKRTRVPAEMCPLIESLTGVTCEELRPDVQWALIRKRRAGDVAQPANATECS